MEYWSLKTPQLEKTEVPAVAPVNVTTIISNTARKHKIHEDTNVWLYYKIEKGFWEALRCLGVKCSEQTVAGSLKVGSEDILTVHCESWTIQRICPSPVPFSLI